jgi:hypothetical protein
MSHRPLTAEQVSHRVRVLRMAMVLADYKRAVLRESLALLQNGVALSVEQERDLLTEWATRVLGVADAD